LTQTKNIGRYPQKIVILSKSKEEARQHAYKSLAKIMGPGDKIPTTGDNPFLDTRSKCVEIENGKDFKIMEENTEWVQIEFHENGREYWLTKDDPLNFETGKNTFVSRS
jgi:hypothetical protein